ncbi:MAG: zf-TFIIB domain-containing protein [Candidatus Calescibacterium sp.]|nr:zf-TFIIB domain-containing protein [Candidatus Calescibacterium sp.]MCX7972085.1 zf-TFIIB domain-containing protein [bacterium]MDW8194630.1 zf-TFIIB domain-containing protein [Candidatus Calescibacterium sp.]
MFKEIFEDILKDLGIATSRRPKELVCPNCSNRMKKLLIKIKKADSHEDLQLDFCQECEGIWFDRGELVKSLEIDIKDISKYFPSKTKESIKGSGRRICPVCQRKLSIINYSKDSNIWVDICSNGCGIFLDSGELELIKLYSINPSYLATVQKRQVLYPGVKEQVSDPKSTLTSFTADIKNLSSKIDNLKNKVIQRTKEIEETIKTKDIGSLRKLIDKEIFAEEKREISELYQEVRNMYQKYSSQREIEELQSTLENIMKFVDIRTNTIKQRVSSEISTLETINYTEKQIESKLEPKENQTVKETNIQQPVNQVLQQTKSQEVQQEVQQLPQQSKTEKQIKTERIKLPGFENIYNYLILNGNLYLFSENKIFIYKDKSFDEIKIKELNFRIKKVKLVNDKVYLLGSSGGIIELDTNMEFRNYYRIGYSDINSLLFTESKILVLSSNRVYFVDNSFKVIQEKSVSTNFLEEFNGKILGGTTSLIVFDAELNKIKEYSMGSYQQIKKVKVLDNKLFLLSSGVLMIFEADNIAKFNLPKSYLELNDIQKIDDIYYICCNSGGFYSTNDFRNYEEIKLNTFDNIYSIIYYGEKIYLGCSNSNVIVFSY